MDHGDLELTDYTNPALFLCTTEVQATVTPLTRREQYAERREPHPTEMLDMMVIGLGLWHQIKKRLTVSHIAPEPMVPQLASPVSGDGTLNSKR